MVVIREYDGYTPMANSLELGQSAYGDITTRFTENTTLYTRSYSSRYNAYFKYGIVFIGYSSPENCAALLTQKNGINVVFINISYRNYMPIKDLVKKLKANYGYSNKNFKYVDFAELRKFFYKNNIPARHITGTYLIDKLINQYESDQIQSVSAAAAE